MVSIFTPEETADGRLHAPATARNRGYIADILQRFITRPGTLLELASGTGEHAAHIAPLLPHTVWQPSDIDHSHLRSIQAWRQHSGVRTLLEPLHLDVLQTPWPLDHLQQPLTAITAINLIHIAPWTVAKTLIYEAGQLLQTDGILYFYGPYRQAGAHTSPSNQAFDQMLHSQNSAWGVRNMEDVSALALDAGFQDPLIIPMPANNFSLVFKKK